MLAGAMRLRRRSVRGLVLLGLVAACAVGHHFRPREGLLNTLQSKQGIAAFHDVAFSAGARGRLDVYAPKNRSAAGRPVVVFFYGGSWMSGTKDDWGWLAYALARHGYVVVVPDYRVYPAVMWPVPVQDAARAVRWTRDGVQQYGGDPGRMVVMGHSAGATSAFELALDPEWLGAVGMDPKRDIRGAVALGGFFDRVPPGRRLAMPVYGGLADSPTIRPITFLSRGAPPLFMGIGGRDAVVEPKDDFDTARKALANGVEVTLVRYRFLSHDWLVKAMAEPVGWIAPTRRDVFGFIDRHTAPRGAPVPSPASKTSG